MKNINQDVEIYCLVLEYICNGTLESYYFKNIGNIPEDFIIKIFKQLLYALSYLHYNRIMHRDVKPNNILLDENNDIKITDFGLCALSKKENPNNFYNNNLYGIPPRSDGDLYGGKTKCGPRKYAPPEVEKKIFYGVEVDIFELGLTMLVLISTKDPISFKKISEKKIIREINENFIKNGYDSDLIHLIKKMINKEGLLRPTAEEALFELELIKNNISQSKFGGFKNAIISINKKYDEKVIKFENLKKQNNNINAGRKGNYNHINNIPNNNIYGNNNINNNIYGNINPNNNIYGNINPNNNIYGNLNSNNNVYGNNNLNNNIYGNNINMNNNYSNNMINSMNLNMNMKLSNPNIDFPLSNSSNDITKVQLNNNFCNEFFDSQIINVIFILNQEKKTTIQTLLDITVEELLKKYEQKAFMKSNNSDYLFIFNYKKLEPTTDMKIREIMIRDNSIINVYDINSLLGS